MRTGLLLLLVGCSSADGPLGREYPSAPPPPNVGPVNDNVYPEEYGPWTCTTFWSDDHAYAKYLKAKIKAQKHPCCARMPDHPSIYKDVRPVMAQGPESANLQWWLSWSRDLGDGPRHIVEGPACVPGNPR